LRIGEPDDAFEREADRVADEVIAAGPLYRHWSLSGMGIGAPLQRKCECGGSGGECEECKKTEQAQNLQRKATGPVDAEFAPPIVHEVVNSTGEPLDRATREFFEPRFGYDFSRVRVHNDAKAAESTRAIRALGYTVGHSVTFAPGRYCPATGEGRHLIAHELAHVVQQDRCTRLASSDGARSTEAPVDISSRAVAAPKPSASAASLVVARQPDPAGGQGGPTQGTAVPTSKIRVVRLDNNVIAEIGRGNTGVANALRKLAADPTVKLEMSRGVYQETVRVTGNMLAARKALIEKLKIEVVDESMEKRAPLYEKYAQSKDFPTHGQPKVTGSERATLEDLPHLASAAAGGEDVELWSFDSRVQTNAGNRGVQLAED
jgi:hypothetical protein